jgi:hypothetical protein
METNEPHPTVCFQSSDGSLVKKEINYVCWARHLPNLTLYFWQLPLLPGWATTIHRSLGLQLSTAVVDLTGAFAAGQVYCALSRVKELDRLSLINPISNENIKVNLAGQRFLTLAHPPGLFFWFIPV